MSLHVTRTAVEILGQGIEPDIRISRIAGEILGEGIESKLFTSRVGIEILGEYVEAEIKATRVALEILGTGIETKTNVSRVVIEVLGNIIYPEIVISRIGLEALGAGVEVEVRVTHFCVEVLGLGVESSIRIPCVGVEVLGSILEDLDPVEEKKMFRMAAPYPTMQTLSVLPNPQFSDQETNLNTVNRLMAVDGTRYTYVRRRTRRRLLWTFHLSRPKALEVQAFLKSYFASRIQITDHRGRVWIGNFTSNPFEFEAISRAAPAIDPMPRGETMSIDIEFEGDEQ